MANDFTANACGLPLSRGPDFIHGHSDSRIMKKYRASFEVIRDEDGYLCAADKKQMIFTDGANREELEANINDAVECYFEAPLDQIEIKVTYLNN